MVVKKVSHNMKGILRVSKDDEAKQ